MRSLHEKVKSDNWLIARTTITTTKKTVGSFAFFTVKNNISTSDLALVFSRIREWEIGLFCK